MEGGQERDGVCAPIPPLHSEAAAAAAEEKCFCRSERQTEKGRKEGEEERAEQAQAGEGGGGNVALVVSFAARLLPPPAPALEKPVLPSLVQVVHQHEERKELNCVTSFCVDLRIITTPIFPP